MNYNALFHHPNIQRNISLTVAYGANEDCIVEPSVFAVVWSVEFGRGTEIELRCAVFAFAHHDKATVADVDVYAVVGLDAIDSLNLVATVLLVNVLIISTAAEDCAFEFRTFKSAANNGNHHALAV